MPEPSRFFVRSPDGRTITGHRDRDGAAMVALSFGEGTHLIDTLAQAYHPMAEEVIGGRLVYMAIGGWDSGRFGLDRDLIEAIKKGSASIVHAFLTKGADADAADANGGPALHWAAAAGKTDIARLLLDHGADAEATDHEGARAIDIAKRRGKTELVELLKTVSE